MNQRERHERVSDLFLRARRWPESERAARLADACGDDLALRMCVEAMLEQDASNDSDLDGPVLGARINLSDLLADDAPRPAPSIAGYRIESVLGA